MSNATFETNIAVDLPDYPAAAVTFTNVAFFISGNSEVFPGKQYTLTLDVNGQGTQGLPCPDNTGDAAVNWRINLPSKESGTFAIAYSAATQQLSVILLSQSSTVDPALGYLVTAAQAAALDAANAPSGSNAVATMADVGGAAVATDTIWDAKGDLAVGTGANTASRLAVGVTNGHVLTIDSAEVTGLKWAAGGSGGASDVGDLTTTGLTAANMLRVAALGGLEERTPAQVRGDIGAAATSHNHTLTDITDSGGAAALNVGTTAGTVAAGDDARLSDARTPTAHAASHATAGSDALTAANIGAEPALGNPAANGDILSSLTDGTRSWVTPSGGGLTNIASAVTGDVATISATLTAPRTYTLPDAGGTIALLGLAQTWTAAQTFNVAISSPGSAASTEQFGAGATATLGASVAVGAGASAAGASIAIGASATAPNGGAICIGRSAGAAAAAGDVIFGSPGAPSTNLYLGNNKISGAPITWTANGVGGAGPNIAGGALGIAGGRSTGNALGGVVNLQTSPAGASGSALNALVTAVQIDAAASVDTRFLLLDVTDGTVKRVTFGADDSGGAGFKVLQVAN